MDITNEDSPDYEPDEERRAFLIRSQEYINAAARLTTTTKAESTQRSYQTTVNDWMVIVSLFLRL